MDQSVGFNFLNDVSSRRVLRVTTLFIYFILFQCIILLQKPFLQFNFIIVFYASFAVLFAHHGYHILSLASIKSEYKNSFYSYLVDFLVLVFFMRYFFYLSSFILILQLFLLFLASFDLDLFELSLLGFVSSVGISVVNLWLHESGSMQSLLSLALFNLSYAAVIIVCQQLKSEFFVLQTDLNYTQKKYTSKNEFSKTLLENIPLGLTVTQNDSEIVLQNSYLQKKLNIDLLEIRKIFKREGSEKRTFVADEDIFVKNMNDQQKILNINETSYFDTVANANLNIYLLRDVTEIRDLENQKRQSEKLAAVGQLAAGIAHEIRNPLAGISGSVQLLSQDTTDETQKKLMNIILKEIDRLNHLITEFLDYAKPEKIPDSPVLLGKILEEVILMSKSQTQSAQQVEWTTQIETEIYILGFPDKLKQAFINMITNGLQAMKDCSLQSFTIKLYRSNERVILSFKDSGCGMSTDTQKRMFEPFHTTKPKGTGLGLAITHKILELHKAQVTVLSEINSGTEIIIKLPTFTGDIK